jgi:uncharacterized protein YbgA (DUF1722 family)/uncharacterized protein YbbK (DUF523 family)
MPATSSVDASAASRIPVGIGACLMGEPVRFNGSHKKGSDALAALAGFFEFRRFCPEVAIGLGVPREPIRLVGPAGEFVDQAELRAVDSVTGIHDVSAALRAYGERVGHEQDDLCGYILVKGSPSCGLERVKRYSENKEGINGQIIKGVSQPANAVGLFAEALIRANPLLPLEEDGRLHDDHLRESFVARVFTYFHWRQLNQQGLTHHALAKFYSRHKYLVMSRHVPTYQALGKLLADAKREPLDQLAPQVITLILDALKRPATRQGHANVLEHIRGYLKRRISAEEKSELGAVIEQYRTGIVPLIAPLTLLKHFFRRYPDAYIEQQIFMQPYPEQLGLRNAI